MCCAEMPKASTSSSGLPECGIPVHGQPFHLPQRDAGFRQRCQHRFAQSALADNGLRRSPDAPPVARTFSASAAPSIGFTQ